MEGGGVMKFDSKVRIDSKKFECEVLNFGQMTDTWRF